MSLLRASESEWEASVLGELLKQKAAAGVKVMIMIMIMTIMMMSQGAGDDLERQEHHCSVGPGGAQRDAWLRRHEGDPQVHILYKMIDSFKEKEGEAISVIFMYG